MEKPSESDLVEKALLFGARNEWAAAFQAWSELSASFSNSFYDLMEFECARILGVELKLRKLANFPLSVIMEYMEPKDAVFLMAETVRRKKTLSIRELESIERYFGVLPKAVAAEISARIPRSKRSMVLTTMRLREVMNLDVRFCIGEEIEIFPKRKIEVPKLNIIHSVLPIEAKGHSFIGRSGVAKILHQVTVIGGSDAIIHRDRFYFDRITYKESRVLNSLKDSVISSFTKKKVVLEEIPEANSSLDEALWLGYPATSSWGHFILECLTRVALSLSDDPLKKIDVLVNADVPLEFLNMLVYIFPGVTVHKIERGASLQLRTCILIPSTVFLPYNLRITSNDVKLHTSDPTSLNFLFKAIHKALARNNATNAKFPSDIYLSRNLSVYRKTRSHDKFENLAKKEGFFVVDPGELNVEDELNLLFNARRVAGLSGSQMLLVGCAATLRDLLLLHHDMLSDVAYGSYAFHDSSGIRAKYILGFRENPETTLSEPSVHQPPQFQTDSLEAFSKWARNSNN